MDIPSTPSWVATSLRRQMRSPGSIREPEARTRGRSETVTAPIGADRAYTTRSSRAPRSSRGPVVQQRRKLEHRRPYRGAAVHPLHGHFDNAGVNLRRHHHVFERCTFEGGWAPVATFGSAGGAPQANIEINAKNLLIDKCLFLAGGGTTARSLHHHVRRDHPQQLFLPARHQLAGPGSADCEIQFTRVSDGTLSGVGPVEIYNNTIINARSSASMRAIPHPDGRRLHSDRREQRRAGSKPCGFSRRRVPSARNRASRGLHLPLHRHAVELPAGLEYPNVSNNTWTAVSRREQPGSPGVLQPGMSRTSSGSSCRIRTGTGLCNGAGFPVTRTRILANSTQKHRVSITDVTPSSWATSISGPRLTGG